MCHRTQVALRLICLPLRKWQRFVRGVDDGEKDQPLVNGICGNILEDYGKDIRTTSLQLKSIDSEAADSLMRRWEQIGAIIESGIERMTSANE